MKIEIRERDRRALLLLAGAMLVYIVVTFAILPVYDSLKEASAAASAKAEQLKKYRRAELRRGNYARLLEQARKSVTDGEARLIPGDNPSLASVEFQTIAETAAKNAGLSLGPRTMSAVRKKDEFYNEITLSTSFDCTANQLTLFLSEIRHAPKYIGLPLIQVSPVQVVQANPATGDLKKTIRVNLTLAALLVAPSLPAATPGRGKG